MTTTELPPAQPTPPKVSASAPPAPPAGELSHREILLVFAGLMAGMLLAALDSSILATAMPTVVGELGGIEQLSWVFTAYLLTTTVATPLYGKLSDLYGRKLLFQAAIVIFLVGSLLCGLSQSMTQLVLFRGVQGIGGGGLMAMAFATIADVVPPRERGRYTGYLGSVFAFSSVVGPLIGGYCVDNLSWRWVFYINLPVGIAALVITSAVLKMPVVRREHSIDWVGAGILIAGVSAFVLALVWGGVDHPWTSPLILGLLAGAAVLTAVFIWWESRVDEPLLPLRLFSDRVFTVASVLCLLVGASMYGAMVFLPLFLQSVTGATATNSGLLLLPLMVGMMAASITSGRIITRTGRYKVWPVTGMAVASVAMLLLSTMDQDTTRVESSAFMLLLGLGLGMVMQVLILAAQNSAEFRDLGVVTSSVNFFRSLGGSIGVAVFGAIMTARLMPALADRLPASAGSGSGSVDLDELMSTPAEIANLPAEIGDAIVGALTVAIQSVFFWATPLLVLGFVLTWFLPEKPLRTTTQASAALPPE